MAGEVKTGPWLEGFAFYVADGQLVYRGAARGVIYCYGVRNLGIKTPPDLAEDMNCEDTSLKLCLVSGKPSRRSHAYTISTAQSNISKSIRHCLTHFATIWQLSSLEQLPHHINRLPRFDRYESETHDWRRMRMSSKRALAGAAKGEVRRPESLGCFTRQPNNSRGSRRA